MAGIDSFGNINFNLPQMQLDTLSNPFAGSGLGESSFGNISLFGTNLAPQLPGFDYTFDMPSAQYSLPFGFVENFETGLNQFAWNGILQLLANFQMPKIDFSALNNFGINNNYNANNLGCDSNPAGYGNFNKKATDLYQGTASALDSQLGGVLKGKGAKLIELQNKYGISASLLAAIATNESGHGTSNAARTKNNVGGVMSKESGYMKLRSFSSVDECLESMAKNLKNNYVDKGLVTVSQIHSKYCPVGAANDPTGMNGGWGSTVSSLMDKYDNLA